MKVKRAVRAGSEECPDEARETGAELISSLTESVRRGLSPSSVLVAGANAERLAEELRRSNIAAEVLDPRRPVSAASRAELFIALDPMSNGTLENVVAGPAAADSVLLYPVRFSAAGFRDLLRLLERRGYWPDFWFTERFLGPLMLLLRRLPAGVALSDNGAGEPGDLSDRLQRIEAELKNQRQRAMAVIALAEALRRDIKLLRGETTKTLDAGKVRVDELELRLASWHAQTDQTARQVTEILRSRTWRTLAGAGGALLALHTLPRRAFRTLVPGGVRARLGLETVLLHCDDPSGDVPVSGVTAVRGWALADTSVCEIRVGIGDGVPVPARAGIRRPDVGSAHPGFPGAAASGFEWEFDSTAFEDGPHLLRLQARSRHGCVRRLDVPFTIDQRHITDYDRWIREFEQSEPDPPMPRTHPRISVVCPVYRPDPDHLSRAIESVMEQRYPHWELCLADDHSDSAAVEAVLRSAAARDPRIRIAFRHARGGISAASNTALAMAGGDFIALLDHDDELAPDALLRVAAEIDRCPDADFLYSDEDKLSLGGRRYAPFFKPDWSPDLLLSSNYICHLAAFRRSLAAEAGGFRSRFDGSQDHDLFLRLTERARRIVHIPRVLYHWRSAPGSTAADPSAKGYARQAARLALEECVARRKLPARVEPGALTGVWRIRYEIPAGARVAIIIPSGGKRAVLQANLDSIASRTTYTAYEIIVVDNSTGSDIRRLVTGWENNGRRAQYLDWRYRRFNYSAMNNEAARSCDAPLLLFLNDDTEVLEPGWLTAMVELCMRPEVGAVGAKLLYPDGTIQHAGVVMGIFDNCGHAFKGLPGDGAHYFGLSDAIRNVSAVTGACLMVRSEAFAKVGGFDEEKLAVAFNDVDLCLRIGQAGYRVLYTPHALLTHHEAFSKTVRDLVPHPAEVAEMQCRWSGVIANDPYYSPSLARHSEGYSLRVR